MVTMRPSSTRMIWSCVAEPRSGLISRPARMAMVCAESSAGKSRSSFFIDPLEPRTNANGRESCWIRVHSRLFAASFLCPNRDGKLVVPYVVESKCDSALWIQADDGGRIHAGQHPAVGEGDVVQRAAEGAGPDELV